MPDASLRTLFNSNESYVRTEHRWLKCSPGFDHRLLACVPCDGGRDAGGDEGARGVLQVSGVLFLSGASTRNLSLAAVDLSCLRQLRERCLVLSNAFKPGLSSASCALRFIHSSSLVPEVVVSFLPFSIVLPLSQVGSGILARHLPPSTWFRSFLVLCLQLAVSTSGYRYAHRAHASRLTHVLLKRTPANTPVPCDKAYHTYGRLNE